MSITYKSAVFVFVLVLALVGYWPALNVGFFLDDYSSFVHNDFIKTLDLGQLFDQFGMRTVVYTSFALDYWLAGISPVYSHSVNLVIHLLNGLLVFSLVKELGRWPRVQTQITEQQLTWIAAISTTLFILHPLQTQAVTYLVQRTTSLVALLYLAALLCYVKWRFKQLNGKSDVFLLVATLLCTLLALFTKQNALTLPVVILAIELVIVRRLTVHWYLTAAMLGLTLLLLADWLFFINGLSFWQLVDQASRENPLYSRMDYLNMQVRVLWEYLVLVFYPISQHLEYANPKVLPWSSSLVWLSALGHGLLIVLAWGLRKRLPLVSFGILFYYLAHLVESSLVPILDAMVEHRTYLPNLGLALALSSALVAALNRLPAPAGNRKASIFLQRGGALAMLLLALPLTYQTWKRNKEWQDPVFFVSKDVAKAPTKARIRINLGRVYIQQGDFKSALHELQKAFRFYGKGGARGEEYPYSLLVNYALVLREVGRVNDARLVESVLIGKATSPQVKANVYTNQSIDFIQTRQFFQARQLLEKALQASPNNVPALVNLGVVYIELNNFAEAEKYLNKALDIEPGNQSAQENLQKMREARDAILEKLKQLEAGNG